MKSPRFFNSKIIFENKGSVTIIAALALPILIAFIALVAECGHGLLLKTENQRIADQAAYAVALAYSSSTSQTTMTSVAQNIATLNGIPAASITASFQTVSPRTATNGAIKIVVTTSEVLLLAPVVGFGDAITVDATAYAEIPEGPSSCVLALNPAGTGVTLTGGTKILAPTCAVASNNSVSVPCGDYITALSVEWNLTAPTEACGGISGTISKILTADPLATNVGVLAAQTRASSNASLAAPTISAIATHADITFDWTNSATTVALNAGCVATFSSGTWTVSCPSGGTYNFGNLSLGGGIVVNFNLSGTLSTTYNFSGSINDSGSALHFGLGNFNVAQGIYSGGGSNTTFAGGVFNVGKGSTACNGVAYYSICQTGSIMSFGASSTFVFTSGVFNSGGETISFGSGENNSFTIGPANDGNALNFGGGSTSTFADATGTGDVFQIDGNIADTGGACTSFGAAANHDIHGNMNVSGGLTLGAGLWAVSGFFGAGVNGGGDVWCAAANANVGVVGTGVTLAVAGLSEITNSNCFDTAFCIGAGFSHISLVSPSSGTYENLALIGPSANNAGIDITEGASATDFGGAIYFPNGQMTLAGGASVGAVSGQCLQIIAYQITLTGGTSASASQCFAGASGVSTPVLVQ